MKFVLDLSNLSLVCAIKVFKSLDDHADFAMGLDEPEYNEIQKSLKSLRKDIQKALEESEQSALVCRVGNTAYWHCDEIAYRKMVTLQGTFYDTAPLAEVYKYKGEWLTTTESDQAWQFLIIIQPA